MSIPVYGAGITSSTHSWLPNSLSIWAFFSETEYQDLGYVHTDLDPAETDVLLQFDLLGDQLPSPLGRRVHPRNPGSGSRFVTIDSSKVRLESRTGTDVRIAPPFRITPAERIASMKLLDPSGDFNVSDVLDVEDIDLLSLEIRLGRYRPQFDLNDDKLVDMIDHGIWVHDLKNTWYGDADLSGEFNSNDFVQVFQRASTKRLWLPAGPKGTGTPVVFRQQRLCCCVPGRRVRTGTTDGRGGGAGAGDRCALMWLPCVSVSRIRAELRRLTLLLALLCVPFCTVHADIYRWDNGQVIPGTEGITPGPGVQLDHRELEYAGLKELDLTGSNFGFSNLTSAHLSDSTLTNADLTGAVVRGAFFSDTTSRGFTKEQLYSTASYQAKDLQGIGLGYNDLTGWDFSGQNLTDASFNGYDLPSDRWRGSDLTQANLGGANLTSADLYYSTLTNADLTGANLTSANMDGSTLTNANLTGTVVTGTNFSRGLSGEGTGSPSELESTASYQAKDLRGIGLGGSDLRGCDLRGQNLSGARLNANLSGRQSGGGQSQRRGHVITRCSGMRT